MVIMQFLTSLVYFTLVWIHHSSRCLPKHNSLLAADNKAQRHLTELQTNANIHHGSNDGIPYILLFQTPLNYDRVGKSCENSQCNNTLHLA